MILIIITFYHPKALAVGDQIEFVAPEGTAGLSCWLRKATIIGFTPNNPTSPLVLDPFHVLPWDYKITQLSPSSAATINDIQVTRLIEEFIFVGELGVQNRATSLIEAGKQARLAQTEIQKAADDWWQSSPQKENKRVVSWASADGDIDTKKRKI